MARAASPAADRPSPQWLALDVLSATRASAEEIGALQRQRLTALLTAAQATRWHRRVLQGRDLSSLPLAALPVTKKVQLMRHFADSVTDPGITLQAVRDFCADPQCIGQPWRGCSVGSPEWASPPGRCGKCTAGC